MNVESLRLASFIGGQTRAGGPLPPARVREVSMFRCGLPRVGSCLLGRATLLLCLLITTLGFIITTLGFITAFVARIRLVTTRLICGGRSHALASFQWGRELPSQGRKPFFGYTPVHPHLPLRRSVLRYILGGFHIDSFWTGFTLGHVFILLCEVPSPLFGSTSCPFQEVAGGGRFLFCCSSRFWHFKALQGRWATVCDQVVDPGPFIVLQMSDRCVGVKG